MVIVENFSVLLGCTFPILWPEISFSGTFLCVPVGISWVPASAAPCLGYVKSEKTQGNPQIVLSWGLPSPADLPSLHLPDSSHV